jgi:hypothetical protein
MIKLKLIVALLTMAVFFYPAKPLLSGDNYQVRWVVEFSSIDLSFDKIMECDLVGFKDFSWTADLGKPMLPKKELRIALPAGMAVKNVYVTDTKTEGIPGEYNIFPTQPPRKIGFSDEDIDFIKPDPSTYSLNQPYPPNLVEFVQQSDLAGQSMAHVLIHPLQYIPAEKRLTLNTSFTLVIDGIDGYECSHYLSPKTSEKNERTYEQILKSLVENPEDVELRTSSKMSTLTLHPDGPFDHVLITDTSFASYFQPLVNWHTKKGVKDTVVTTSWIYANYAGSSNQEKIRNFIIDANTDWGTAYFLLAGEHESIPFEYRIYDEEDTPSDQYYSDYDDDWVHEVYVGRASVDTTNQINTFINKVLKYEKDPPRSDYPLDVLLIGMDADSETHTEELKDYIYNEYIPSNFNVKKVYDSHGGNHRDSVIHHLNSGQNLVNHSDHSGTTKMGTGHENHGWDIDTTDVDLLTNDGQMSVVVSLGCKPNNMTHPLYDCIAEHFVIYNPNQAGVAFTGNTRCGLYYSADLFALSNLLDIKWWKALLETQVYNAGATLVQCKHDFDNSDKYEKHCEWTFNLLGEPEMPIWTDEPDSFAVTFPPLLPTGGTPFSVHVEDSTTLNPVDQAYVCLWKEGEVYLTGYTDPNGDVTFDPWSTTPGIMYVTVTQHNYIPYESFAWVYHGKDWPMFLYSPQHGGTNLGGISTADTNLQWSLKLDSPVLSSPVIGNDGIIYIGSMSSNSKLYAIRPDGTVKWTYYYDLGQITTAPALSPDGSRIYFFTQQSPYEKVIARDVSDGLGGWREILPDGDWVSTSNPAVIDEDGTPIIYVCGANNYMEKYRLYRIADNGFSGNIDWYIELPMPETGITPSPAVAGDGTIYIGAGGDYNQSRNGALYAVNPNGSVKWFIEVTTSTDEAALSASVKEEAGQERIYIGTTDHRMCSIKEDQGENSGSLMWCYNNDDDGIGEPVTTSPVVTDMDADGNMEVVFGTSSDTEGHVYAITDLGRRYDSLWITTMGSIFSSVAIGCVPNTPSDYFAIFIGSGDNRIYTLAGSDGSVLAQFETGYPIISSPAVCPSPPVWGNLPGWILIGSDDSCLYAFGPAVLGDVNDDDIITVADVVYLVGWLFKSLMPPQCEPIVCCADADCSGVPNIADAVYLINYLFRSGPHPCAE